MTKLFGLITLDNTGNELATQDLPKFLLNHFHSFSKNRLVSVCEREERVRDDWLPELTMA